MQVRALKGRNLQEQIKKKPYKAAETDDSVWQAEEARRKERLEKQKELAEDLDDVLEDIDALLGENEVEMAKNFVQKGGQ